MPINQANAHWLSIDAPVDKPDVGHGKSENSQNGKPKHSHQIMRKYEAARHSAPQAQGDPIKRSGHDFVYIIYIRGEPRSQNNGETRVRLIWTR